MTLTNRHARLLLLLSFASPAVVVGCASTQQSPGTVEPVSDKPTTDAVVGDRRVPYSPNGDVAFIDFFVDHHRNAIAMAQMVVDRGAREDVRATARTVIDKQTSEMAKMRAARGELTGAAESPQGPPDPVMTAHMDMMKSMFGNELDMMFMTMMIEHHAAGLSPAKRALDTLQRADMRALAQSIFEGQGEEIGALEAMGAPPPSAVKVTEGDKTLDGDRRVPLTPGNDVVFIDFFVTHHTLAIEMAQMVVERGAREDVKTLARKIIDAQQKELADMRAARALLVGNPESPAPPADAHRSKDMQVMGSISGAELDEMFLKEMTAHHAAGLPTAARARPLVQRTDMQTLSEKIFETQAKEIGEMSRMRQTKGS